eukprot:6455137-Amphidinium_carterae.1
MDGPSHAVVKSAEYGALADMLFDEAAHTNYKSYEEAGVLATEEVERLVARGFVEHFADWRDIQDKWPQAKATKVGVIVKERLDGTHKVRFVMDFLRSGVNGTLAVPEKVPLPRAADAMAG